MADTIRWAGVWDLEKSKPGLWAGEAALSAPGERKRYLWPCQGERDYPATSSRDIKGDLIRQREVQEVAGLHARHVVVFGVPSWPPARGTGAASGWRDGPARAKERQAWPWVRCVRLPSELQKGRDTSLGIRARVKCQGRRRLQGVPSCTPSTHGLGPCSQTTLNLIFWRWQGPALFSVPITMTTAIRHG